MKIHCLYDKLVPVKELKFHPDNPNKHTDNQIERLAKILAYQGFRYPIKVSKQSGYITSGHGRLLAALHNKWEEVPVNYQDYENADQEYADVVADNAIASWSQLDFGMVNAAIPEFDPSFDLDLLGLHNFLLEPAEKFLEKELWVDPMEVGGSDIKVVVIVNDMRAREELLKVLNIRKQKKFKDGLITSVHWPDTGEVDE